MFISLRSFTITVSGEEGGAQVEGDERSVIRLEPLWVKEPGCRSWWREVGWGEGCVKVIHDLIPSYHIAFFSLYYQIVK